MNSRIKQLFSSGPQSPSALSVAAGLPNSALAEWGKGKSRPSLDAVIKIAKFFGVSIDWIVFGDDCVNYKRFPFDDSEWLNGRRPSIEEPPKKPTVTTTEVQDMYNSLSDLDKGRVLSYMDALLHSPAPTPLYATGRKKMRV